MAALLEPEEDVLIQGRYHDTSATKEAFLQWSPPDDEPFLYEFNDGLLKSKPAMKPAESGILK